MRKTLCLLLIIINLLIGFGLYSPILGADYILAPNDQLEVRLIGQKDLDTKQTVAPDGTISLPLLGRVTAQGQTLASFNNYLSAEFAKYIKSPQVVVYLTPRPTYVIQHDVKKNTWEVKEAKSIDEARALAGRNYTGQISNGDIVSVEVSEEPDFWEQNWYKIITATAVLISINSALHK